MIKFLDLLMPPEDLLFDASPCGFAQRVTAYATGESQRQEEKCDEPHKEVDGPIIGRVAVEFIPTEDFANAESRLDATALTLEGC